MVVGSLDVETDVLVIGSGPGGYVAAIRAAMLGKEVMVVEKEKKLGGVCLNTGCIPTKAMIHASNYYHTLQELDQMGIHVDKYFVDVNKMKSWKNDVVAKLEAGIQALFTHYGIEVIEASAVFVSPNKVRISGKTDIVSVKYKNCIIATGSSPVQLPGFEFDGEKVISSTEVLDLNYIPKTAAIIGGGYIGTEMGTVLAKLGCKVTILELGDKLLPVIDQELARVVVNKLTHFDIKVLLNTKVISQTIKGNEVEITISNSAGESKIVAEKLIVVVGRSPNSKAIGLDAAGVKVNEKGFIVVDSQMRTSNKDVFAIGDVVGQPMLAHKASCEGKIAAEVICGHPSAFDRKVIPFVVFNDPEIASVGLTESEAITKGIDIIVGKFPFSALGRAMTLNQAEGFVKIVADKKTHIVIGVHAVGPNVSDIISEAALAIEMSATLEDISGTIHPHPTMPESIMEAAENALGWGVHTFNKKS